MRDIPKMLTIPGLIVFIGILAFPVFYNTLIGKAAYKPDPKIVTQEKECVKPKSVMKAEHMTIVFEWRDEVVRDGERDYTASNGRHYDKSLSNTCMECHSNKAQFCDECHNYVGVKPYCWECHVEPKENK